MPFSSSSLIRVAWVNRGGGWVKCCSSEKPTAAASTSAFDAPFESAFTGVRGLIKVNWSPSLLGEKEAAPSSSGAYCHCIEQRVEEVGRALSPVDLGPAPEGWTTPALE